MAKHSTTTKLNRGKYRALLLATAALTLNFWAWSLLSPLGTRYAEVLSLGPAQLSLLLAIPIIVGSLGRVAFGIITDKIGGQKTFVALSLLTALPVFGLMWADTYLQLLMVAAILGIGGTAFVIGVPFLSAWFPPNNRGLVLGVYSLGNAGTAAAGFFTPRLADLIGQDNTFLLVGVLLIVMAGLLLGIGENSPAWRAPKGSSLTRLAATMRFRATWDLSAVYIVTFGALVAFGVYLPVLLHEAYDLSQTDAATRAAGFILLSTVARPIGGWLSDKLGGRLVIRATLVIVVILASFVALQPTLAIPTTIAYLSLAFTLGCASGAVFAIVGRLTPPAYMGSVSGVIGAVGVLGGFLPPLVLGLTYEYTQSYAMALLMLAATALLVFIYIKSRFRDQKIYRHLP